jgi:DNA-binding transcriptional regulator YdaS (Cro superfamily)
MTRAKLPLVDRIIDKLGGPSKAANVLGIDNPSVVLNWRKRGKIPAERVLAVEAATGISRHELRPDIFGPTPEASAA